MQTSIANVILSDAPAAAVAALIAEGVAPLAARIFAARGIDSRFAISPLLKNLPLPEEFPGVKRMAAALAEVCAHAEPICVVGDYDVDGVTATAVMYDCLRRLGANASWYIPSRRKEGYGLSAAIVEEQAAAGIKHLLTVDNGISAHAGIARARELGLRVYVTDHHRPDGDSNQADYLVNPHADNSTGEMFNSLVGVGIAFYLAAQLRRELDATLDMATYLDLVALGTIADCGKMDANNRALTAAGLAHIRAGKTRPGIIALAEHGGIKLDTINSRAVGFRMVPRLNAAGRMGSATVAMDCLLAKDVAAARPHVLRLNVLNDERLRRQDEVMNAVLTQIDGSCAGIVVSGGSWHPGVVGIVAGKIAERFRRPAFAFCLENDAHWRGSGRAPAEVDLMGILTGIAAAHPQMLLGFGGHRQAAGVVVEKNSLQSFSGLFDSACRAANDNLSPPPIAVDAVSTEGITGEALAQLENVVWGNGFSPPLYAGRFSIVSLAPLRGGYLRLLLAEVGSGNKFNAVYFGDSQLPEAEVSILYRANINPYDGKPQLIIDKILPME